MLARHPGLRVVACHLASLEYDIDRLAACSIATHVPRLMSRRGLFTCNSSRATRSARS